MNDQMKAQMLRTVFELNAIVSTDQNWIEEDGPRGMRRLYFRYNPKEVSPRQIPLVHFQLTDRVWVSPITDTTTYGAREVHENGEPVANGLKIYVRVIGARRLHNNRV